MNGVQRFETEVRAVGADGAEALRQILLGAGALEGLDENVRQAMKAEARLRFGSREFSLAEAARAKMLGSWDITGGATGRDIALHGAAVGIFLSLTSAPFEFSWRVTDAGIVFQSR